MADIQKAIVALERDYAEHKDAFEKWREENATLSDTDAYAEYVDQFRVWEKGVLEQLKELRTAVARQPIAPEPELPMVDLDTQLNALLQKVNAPQFVLAFMTMAQKDPSFLKKAFDVVMEECKATGFSNPILPQAAQQMHTSRSAPSFGNATARFPQLVAPYTSGVAQTAGSSGDADLYLPPHPYVQGPSLLTSSSTNRYNTQSYTQITPYGAIPEGWVVDAPIRRQQKPASPVREYRNPMKNLPFKDFSQN